MTLNDFKMWLSGFAEHITEAPTPAQWKRILEALASVPDGGTVVKPPVNIPSVWIDRQQGIPNGTGNPPPNWPQILSQNSPEAQADRQRRTQNNQTVEVQ